jgi:hypothetical protein
MRTNIYRIVQRTKQVLLSQNTIVLNWVEIEGGTVDRTTGQLVGGTIRNRSTTVKAFVHYTSPSKTGYQVFSEIEVGQAILDMDPDVLIDGKNDLTFVFGEKTWVQARVGEKLSKSWDTMIQDQRLFRTVLVEQRA